MRQTITWTNGGPVYQRIYASRRVGELNILLISRMSVNDALCYQSSIEMDYITTSSCEHFGMFMGVWIMWKYQMKWQIIALAKVAIPLKFPGWTLTHHTIQKVFLNMVYVYMDYVIRIRAFLQTETELGQGWEIVST